MARLSHPLLAILVVALAVALCSAACKKDDATPAGADTASAAPTASTPTKDEVVALLRTVDERLTDRAFAGMDAFFGIPQGFSAEQLEGNLAALQERGELSASGIDALAARGAYGPAADVVGPERAARFAEKFGVTAADCVALAADGAEVVLCRFPDGKSRIVRLDDVGRLE